MSLLALLFDENIIQRLPENVFLYLTTLRILRLRYNEISSVHSNSLTGLVELRELDLTGNRISMLPLGMFDPLGWLQRVSLGHNNIRRVAKKPFQSCRDLRSLDLEYNQLPAITADWFVSTTRLTVVKLASNLIQSVEAGAFNQLQLLEEMDLQENYLSDLGERLFASCQSLRTLNLARNPLRRFTWPGTSFLGLTALTRLDLRGCCITELVLHSSAPLPALTELYLGDNLLTNISRQSLAATTALQRLDLTDNVISTVEAGALSSLASLNWLNLSRNLLTENQLAAGLQTVPSDIVVDASRNRVKSLASLTTPLGGVYISRNPLVCSCTSPSWISLQDTSRFLDANRTLCSPGGSSSTYLLCYWSRCGSQSDHQLCSAPVPPTTDSMASSPTKVCRLDAALTVFGPRFVDFEAYALSPSSARFSWNISDELNTAAGYQFTLTVVDNCTNASAAIFSMIGNETSYTTPYDSDVNRTDIEIGNLTSGAVYVACADVFQTPRGNSNRTKVSDTQCACLELPEETTTALPTTTLMPTTTTVTTTTTTMTSTTTTTTSLPTTTTLTTTTTPTTTTTRTTTAEPTTTTPSTTTTQTTTTTTTPTTATSTTTTTPTTTPTTTTGTTARPTTARATTTATATTTTTTSTAAETTPRLQTTTTARRARTAKPPYLPPADILIWARSNKTAIFVTWVTVNTTARYPYFWLICFDEENRQVESADVTGYSYVFGNLTESATYNVCVTAITYSDFKDPTFCVLVRTGKESPGGEVEPPTSGRGLFLIIVIAVPIACLLLVLLIVCIALLAGYRRRRRRRNKPREAEITSSSTCDSSNGNTCAQQPEQSGLALNVYDEVVPSAPPLQDPNNPVYWNNIRDPLPLQSTLSLNIYDDALSY